MSDPVMTLPAPDRKLFRVSFAIAGKPVAKGRPRARLVKPRTGEPFITMYSDKKTVAAEKTIRQGAALVMRFREPLQCPCRLVVTAYVPIPKSWAKSARAHAAAGLIHPTVKPDVDNYLKIVMDACNGIVYADDKQVVQVVASKRYSREPRLAIQVEEME